MGFCDLYDLCASVVNTNPYRSRPPFHGETPLALHHEGTKGTKGTKNNKFSLLRLLLGSPAGDPPKSGCGFTTETRRARRYTEQTTDCLSSFVVVFRAFRVSVVNLAMLVKPLEHALHATED